MSPDGPIDHEMVAESGWDPVRYLAVESAMLKVICAIGSPAPEGEQYMCLRITDVNWLLDTCRRLAAMATRAHVVSASIVRNAERVIAMNGGKPDDVAALLGLGPEARAALYGHDPAATKGGPG